MDEAVERLASTAMSVIGNTVTRGEVPEEIKKALSEAFPAAQAALLEQEKNVAKIKNAIAEARKVQELYCKAPEETNE